MREGLGRGLGRFVVDDSRLNGNKVDARRSLGAKEGESYLDDLKFCVVFLSRVRRRLG